MKLLIITQVYENYGYSDNAAESKPYWKAKGGDEYFVALDEKHMTWPLNGYINSVLDKAKPLIEVDNEAYRCFIIGHEIVQDDYRTEFEQSQLEYDGTITYPAKIIDLSKIA